MRKQFNRYAVFFSLLAIAALSLTLLTGAMPGASAQQKQDSKSNDKRAEQIQALINEKKARSSAEKKVDSQFLYALKQGRGETIAASTNFQIMAEINADGTTLVDIKGELSKEFLSEIERSGGKILYVSEAHNTVRAQLALTSVESIAAREDVKSIKPADTGRTNKIEIGTFFGAERYVDQTALLRLRGTTRLQNAGAVVTQGDTTHQAAFARNVFGANGAGVKVGVLSDSVKFLAQSQAAGELPSNVTIVPGQSGVGGTFDSGEGTAMLEIIHDLAPGAQLFFATGLGEGGAAQFADNIRRLRFQFGCDIIVDDIFYGGQAAFQDDVIARAVNDVTASGGLYFSSAGNQGNFNDGYASLWEGDFRAGGAIPGAGTVHDFGGGVTSDEVLANTDPAGFFLKWSDRIAGSANDYDLLAFDPDGNLVAASTNIQDGDDDPFEGLGGGGDLTGFSFGILRNDGAAVRAVRLEGYYAIFERQTPGRIWGHPAARDAVAVAATPTGPAVFPFIGSPTGPFPFPFNPSNKVEVFSNDGPRRIFYNANGTPVKPNNFLFATNGGTVRLKPEITAADGVSTSVPGFETFFGTSAAAPHAAAIAALVKSRNRSLSAQQVKNNLYLTAIDIEAPGRDRDSGFGIADAFGAVAITPPRR